MKFQRLCKDDLDIQYLDFVSFVPSFVSFVIHLIALPGVHKEHKGRHEGHESKLNISESILLIKFPYSRLIVQKGKGVKEGYA